MAPLIMKDGVSQELIIEYLKSKNIGSRTIYSLLSYQQPCYQDLSKWPLSRVINYPDYSKDKCSAAEKIAKQHFELPMVTSLTKENVEYIAETLKQYFQLNTTK